MPRIRDVDPLQHLIDTLGRLPGVGPRTAQRMAWHLLQRDREGAEKLALTLQQALESLRPCERCNAFTSTTLCDLCADPDRDDSLLCVVESPADQLMIEQSLAFRGLYFILMGRLSPLDGVGAQDLQLQRLVKRACDQRVSEVVLATNFTHEGEATAHYVSELLRSHGLRVSRLARGVPVGGELEYIDLATIAQAIHDRRTPER